MSEAIFGIWYDLAPDRRAGFLDWLHGTHLPAMLTRPGFAWAASYENKTAGSRMDEIAEVVARPGEQEVPGGSQYLTLFGAPDPHVFFNPRIDQVEIEAAGTHAADRLGMRSCVFIEEAYTAGPEMARRPKGACPGPAIQMGSFRTKTIEDEWDLEAWYAQYRLPAVSGMAGVIGTRKLAGIAGWAKHSIMYEFVSLEERNAHFQNHESLAMDQTVWTNKIINYTIHTPGSPFVGRRLWPAAG